MPNPSFKLMSPGKPAAASHVNRQTPQGFMQLAPHWEEVRRVVGDGQRSAMHCAIASVSPDGAPHVTPVGTLFLRDNCTGYYFDQYTSSLARNVDHDARVCVMAVNSGSWFWFTSLLFGRFKSPPGVRLCGTVSAARPAEPAELQAVRKRVGHARYLTGGRLLWSQFETVRDIAFTEFHPVTYPSMVEGLWQPVAPDPSFRAAMAHVP